MEGMLGGVSGSPDTVVAVYNHSKPGSHLVPPDPGGAATLLLTADRMLERRCYC